MLPGVDRAGRHDGALTAAGRSRTGGRASRCLAPGFTPPGSRVTPLSGTGYLAPCASAANVACRVHRGGLYGRLLGRYGVAEGELRNTRTRKGLRCKKSFCTLEFATRSSEVRAVGVKVIWRNCPDCGEKRPFEKERINHVLHLLLTLVTAGLWLVVWVVLGLLSMLRPYRCRACGHARY